MDRICDCMQHSVITCRIEDSVQHVAELMNDNQIRTMVVVDAGGIFWGVIAVLDLLPVLGKELEEMTAEDIMHPCEFIVDPQLPIEEAVVLMEKHEIEYLVISDEGAGKTQPVGIITSYDIVRQMARINMGRTVAAIRLGDTR